MSFAYHCRCKALKSHDSTSRSSDVLQPGILINYRKDDKHILALVMEPDGKKNWWIVDQVCFVAAAEDQGSGIDQTTCCGLTLELCRDFTNPVIAVRSGFLPRSQQSGEMILPGPGSLPK